MFAVFTEEQDRTNPGLLMANTARSDDPIWPSLPGAQYAAEA